MAFLHVLNTKIRKEKVQCKMFRRMTIVVCACMRACVRACGCVRRCMRVCLLCYMGRNVGRFSVVTRSTFIVFITDGSGQFLAFLA